MTATERLKDLVFPQGLYCNCCGKYIDETRTYGLCDHCIRRMTFKTTFLPSGGESPLDRAAAVMDYGLYSKQIIFGLKYDRRTYMAPVAARILYDALTSIAAGGEECPWLAADVIIPVPVSRERLKERGFNQMQKIGKHLSKMTGIRLEDCVLVREKHTKAQRALSAAERKINMKGAFRTGIKGAERIKNKRVLLIDDIYTTGATASECGAALKGAGAEKVYFLSLLTAPAGDKIR